MKISFFDGGMIFEINKKYSDYGQYAILNDKNLIKKLHKGYVDIGCEYITSCNYCFTPKKVNNWEDLTKISIDLIQDNKAKIFGSIPPFFKSYKIEEITDDFYNFYYKLIQLFKNKIDIYLLETCVEYNHVKEIVKIIKEMDKDAKIIVSLYPNQENSKKIKDYMELDIYGIFINCCSFDTMVSFFNNNLRDCNFKNKKFGFYCNNINEKKYSEELIIGDLKNFYEKDNITKIKIKSFLETLPFNEIFIGGCCGYGIEEMKELKNMLT